MNRKRAGIAVVILLGAAFLYGAVAPPTLGSVATDRSILLQNDRERDVTLTVTIEYQSSNIYRETLTVAAHSKVEAANVSANPLHIGLQHVTATVTDPSGGSASLRLAVSDCYGPAYFIYEPNGEIVTIPHSVAC
ncbi:hypothetical protein [Halosimplex marinum]|uniref:hypothetical protein n=1 Tax=Halosimplex marinum TaxID=3396620 RepID=UPI003F57EA82